MSSDTVHTGRRTAPRLRLSLPGQFLAVRGNLRCIITNMSQTGVLMAVEETLKVGDEGYLGCGPIDQFMIVKRCDRGFNALAFECPVSHELVLRVRKYQETFAEREKAELLANARAWSEG